jgi:ankyrin repeat protein
VKLLLEQNANAEAQDNDGQSLIVLAAKNGHEQVVKLLLEQNVNIEVKDNDGWTTLVGSLKWARRGGKAIAREEAIIRKIY